MKKIFNRKTLIIVISIILALCLSIVGIYIYLKNRKVDVSFSLIGDDEIVIEYGTKYEELGYKLIVNEKEIKDGINITNNINYELLGSYNINYLYIDKYKKYHQISRKVTIIDSTSPLISLIGETNMKILLNEKYQEPGYEAFDNYDKELNDLVKIDSNLDTSKVGEYVINYSVEDSSNNKFEISRNVKVIKPKPVVTYTETKSVEATTNTNNIKQNVSNTITKNKFTSSGIYISGYVKNSNDTYKILLKNDSNTYEFNMNKEDSNNYSGNIDVSKIMNGDYSIYIVSNEEERLLNKMESIERIARAKVGNKLVTFNYDNDKVNIKIGDFSYQYDILIDPGHGGYDTGAVNEYIYEKEMNLITSLYEKCRYEEHGYSVYMIRTDDTYGKLMGDSSWRNLSKRSYTIGYYGVVSKIIYSNHNNSTSSSKTSGYEILTPAQYDNLSPELKIASKFNSIYPLTESHKRVYTRDYEVGNLYSTLNNEKYNFRNYYATIRIPYELFNVKSVTYEGFYMSNLDDYNWYWKEGNWKKVSEIKIEEYVKSLGGTYNPETSCS